MCLFPFLLERQMTQPSSGCTNTSENKEGILMAEKPHTHAAKRTDRHPAAWSHYAEELSLHSSTTFTGKLWAVKDSLKKKRELREWSQNLGHRTSASLPLLIHADLCYIGAIPTARDNILAWATSEEHRGPQTMCKVILAAAVSPSRKIWETVKISQKKQRKKINLIH